MTKLYVWGIQIGHKDCDNNWNPGANAAGGISVKLSFKNNTDKTIKYLRFPFVPYNAVGDEVKCTVTDVSLFPGRLTGPFAPGEVQTASWQNVWYNHTITTVKLSYVLCEFMDGSEALIEGEDLSFSIPDGSSGGCYVATAVYGSYDCPQVWTLRRYRDNILACTRYGRMFIRIYYAISPILVKWFGQTSWFRIIWRRKLDRMVAKLQIDGVESSPYEDKLW